ncbi:MAG: hypothetical protein WC151_11870 [Bacteroidales bacterium]
MIAWKTAAATTLKAQLQRKVASPWLIESYGRGSLSRALPEVAITNLNPSFLAR